jgi:hypothetical protein
MLAMCVCVCVCVCACVRVHVYEHGAGGVERVGCAGAGIIKVCKDQYAHVCIH